MKNNNSRALNMKKKKIDVITDPEQFESLIIKRTFNIYIFTGVIGDNPVSIIKSSPENKW